MVASGGQWVDAGLAELCNAPEKDTFMFYMFYQN